MITITTTPEQEQFIRAHIDDPEELCLNALWEAITRSVSQEPREQANQAIRTAVENARSQFPERPEPQGGSANR